MINVWAWYDNFRRTISQDKHANPLREAALASNLKEWTRLLTAVVVEVCGNLGWTAVAKEHTQEILPVKRQEYLGLDVMAFESSSPRGRTNKWRPPVAVFELENRDNEDLIAYSVWKACVVRCQFRGILCYRRNPSEIPNLAATLGDSVIAEEDQFPLLLIVGSRSKTETFPDGFFHPWYWDQRWRCFRKLL